MKLLTTVDVPRNGLQFTLHDRIMVLGSCFADEIGSRLLKAGFDACVNPFGTLYNPVSIANSVARLGSGIPFRKEDCVAMGAGAGLICSWWHHTSFARKDEEQFLHDANAALELASAFWKDCNKVIVSLGTAMVWNLRENGETVSNCLKRPAAEFSHEMLPLPAVSAVLQRLVRSSPDKQFLFTVSPIRHLGEGAHTNTISKSTLLLALDGIGADYFPAYEILMDELRDYRFYADDLVHPSKLAADIIWERFLDSAGDPAERERIKENEKAARFAAHRHKNIV